MKVRKTHALRRQRIQRRRLHRSAVTTAVLPTEVIREQDDNVRALSAPPLHEATAEQDRDENHEAHHRVLSLSQAMKLSGHIAAVFPRFSPSPKP